MHYLIRFDSSGTEISREPTKRGRPPVGAIKQPNGDLHVYAGKAPVSLETAILPSDEKAVSSENNTPAPVNEPEPEDDEPVKGRKTYTASAKIDLEKFLKACKHMTKDEKSGVITLYNPVIIHETGVPEVKFNAVYTKIQVDTRAGSMALWGDLDKPPKVVVNGLF